MFRRKRFVNLGPAYYLKIDSITSFTPHLPWREDKRRGVWVDAAGVTNVFVPLVAIKLCKDKEIRKILERIGKFSQTIEEKAQQQEDKETDFATQRNGDVSDRAKPREDNVAMSDSIKSRNSGD